LDETEKPETKVNAKKRGVKFCPRCGSPEIYWARGLPQLWSIWECRNCGYHGAFIVEDGQMSKKLQEEYAKKHLHKDEQQP
jgi:predicted RNA-binding Zn-ribbon protein involved in translation (DUF1610 family)